MTFSILINNITDSIFQIITKSAFQSTSIIIKECSISVSLSCFPLSFINSLDALIIQLSFEPEVATPARRNIISPVSFVLLESRVPIHHTEAFFLISFPLSFILIVRLISHFPFSLSQSILKITLINPSI